MKGETRKEVGVVTRKTQAIDFTPIYFFIATRDIKAGTKLRWDTAENELVVVETGWIDTNKA